MMSADLLAVLVLVPTAAVVAGVFAVMWLQRRSSRDAVIAVIPASERL
jgi:hypothetical protein